MIDIPLFDRESIPSIKWYHWLFLWILPTHKILMQSEGMVIFLKTWRGRVFLMDAKSFYVSKEDRIKKLKCFLN